MSDRLPSVEVPGAGATRRLGAFGALDTPVTGVESAQ
jgi:hypothetical protein